MTTIESYEIIFPHNKHHSETCPVCTPEDDDEAVPMIRRSPDVYQCEECGLLILAGFDKYKMGKRIYLGKASDEAYCDQAAWIPGSGPPPFTPKK